MQKESESKGGIKRRITQACILCRKKKIKCDGAKPECVHCLDANLNCQYTEYKKRGPHKGYVRLLEERLALLEKRLASTGAEVPPPISPLSPYSPPKQQHTVVDDFPPQEIVTHLIDLFFQHINSVFPFVHRARLKQSILDGNVSKPLIWGVMAIAARFSKHPQIKTDPPYWAGERFATKATSLINASLLEPTIPNLQFWGIMSCLEYGRASGSKAWIYGGIAVRICQELGLDKEETLKTPIISKTGTIDYVAMALRRRIFWSCLCIDKFASTSTNRPQGFEIGDYDVQYPSLSESSLLRDPFHALTIDQHTIANDPLMDVVPRYIHVLERFGEVCKYMSRAKTNTSAVTWPPIAESTVLDARMKHWLESLPKVYQFSQAHLELYKENASQNYLNFWLCSHAMYCTGMLALHRGSLAYSDLTASDLPPDVYDRIQASIHVCKVNVDIATEVFQALHDVCGVNVLPYMCYCAYIFSTVLMTSAFSSDPVSYRKSSASLAILYDMIELLSPYWPMSERLASTTRDMLSAHSRLYDVQEQQQRHEYGFDKKRFQAQNGNEGSIASSVTPTTGVEASRQPQPQQGRFGYMDNNMPVQMPILPYGQDRPEEVDFNSCAYLYDSTLFGQMVFDSTKVNNSEMNYLPQDQYSVMLNETNYPYEKGSWGNSCQ